MLFLLVFCLSFCCSVFAAPAHKVCVDVCAMSGYDSPDVGDDKWYSDVYGMLAEELNANGVLTEHSKDVWAEFVRSLGNGKGSVYIDEKKGKTAHEMFADFRKDRFDHILKFKTDRFVTYGDLGTSDIAVTLTVLKADDVDGAPLAVYKDSRTDMKASERDEVFKRMIKSMVDRYVNG